MPTVSGETLQPLSYGPDEAVDWVGAVLSDIVDRCAGAVRPEVARVVHVNPGSTVPHDDSCGQIAGRVLTITPWTGPGGAVQRPCGVWEWIVTLGVSIARCVSTLNDDGEAPTEDEMDLDGLQMLRDMANMQAAIMTHPMVRTFGAWNQSAARGGMVQGEWTFQVRVPVCEVPERIRNLPTGATPA